jgi:hypothetical protein
MWLGYCIAEWANLEEQLFLICRDCLGSYEQAAIVYYRQPGIDVRIQMVDELVRSILPRKQSGEHDHEDVKIWHQLFKGIKKLLSVRRRIAHQPVRTSQNALAILVMGTAQKFVVGNPAVSMSRHEEKRGRGLEDKPILLADLKTHLAEVKIVTAALSNFLDILEKHPM